MKSFARVTSVVFVALGSLLIFVGIILAFSGVLGGKSPAVSAPNLISAPSGLVSMARFFLGGAVSLQGFFLAAIGQGIWLLVDIANSTEKSSAYFKALMRKNAAKQ